MVKNGFVKRYFIKFFTTNSNISLYFQEPKEEAPQVRIYFNYLLNCIKHISTTYKVDTPTHPEIQKLPSMKETAQKRPSIKIDPHKESSTDNEASMSDAVEEAIKSTDSSRKSSFSSRSYSPNLENNNQLLEVQRTCFLSNDPILLLIIFKGNHFCFLAFLSKI